MKSANLLQAFVESLTLEIREKEENKAENRAFTKLETNDLNVYVESFPSLEEEKGRKFILTIVINQKPYKGTFTITDREAMDLNYPFDKRVTDAIQGIVTESIFNAVKIDLAKRK